MRDAWEGGATGQTGPVSNSAKIVACNAHPCLRTAPRRTDESFQRRLDRRGDLFWPRNREVDCVVKGLLLDVWQQIEAPGRAVVGARRRQRLVGVVKIVAG